MQSRRFQASAPSWLRNSEKKRTRGSRSGCNTTDSLVENNTAALRALGFSLDEAILLAGLAFEAYNPEPEGGVDETDSFGTRIRYLSPVVRELFDGVLSVTIWGCSNLAAADLHGTSDVYVRVTFAGSTRSTDIQRFSTNPTFNTELDLLASPLSEESDGTLLVRVFDSDVFSSDDDLGYAAMSISQLLDGHPHDTTLPLSSIPNSRVEASGSVSLRVQFHQFPPNAFDTFHQWSKQPYIPSFVGSLADGITEMQSELQRKNWEEQLWAVPRNWEWSVLASERGKHKHTPDDFEKICFIEQTKTDTQACIWRYRAGSNTRKLAVAFRGTEVSKPEDIFNDLKLMPVKAEEEAQIHLVPSKGGFTDPQLHAGFLEAYASVRNPIFKIMRTLLAQMEDDEDCEVYVTGHSLGGALAKIFALDLSTRIQEGHIPKSDTVRCTMYSMGSPRVGDAAFAHAYNSLVHRSFRIANQSDAIVTIPALLGYKHVKHCVILLNSGDLFYKPDASKSTVDMDDREDEMFKQARAEAEGAANDAFEAMRSIIDRESLESHFEDKYFEALKLVQTKGAEHN